MSIEVSNEQVAAMKAKAAAQGLKLQEWLRKIIEEPEVTPAAEPLKSGYGLLAKYGSASSAEEIDANRREMFRGFAEDSE